jgi:hypothetical protein
VTDFSGATVGESENWSTCREVIAFTACEDENLRLLSSLPQNVYHTRKAVVVCKNNRVVEENCSRLPVLSQKIGKGQASEHSELLASTNAQLT